MNRFIRTKMIYLLLGIILLIALYSFYWKNIGQAKVSEFGKYQGYSEATDSSAPRSFFPHS